MGFRPRVSETRVYTLHHSPKKSGAAGATCTLTRLAAQRFLRPPGLLFHARPQNGRGGRSRTGTGNDAQRGLSLPCLLFQPRRDKLVRTEGIAPSWTFVHRLLGPTRLLFRHIRKNWSIHRDVRPARCLTKTVRRYLRLGCMVEAEGLAPS